MVVVLQVGVFISLYMYFIIRKFQNRLINKSLIVVSVILFLQFFLFMDMHVLFRHLSLVFLVLRMLFSLLISGTLIYGSLSRLDRTKIIKSTKAHKLGMAYHILLLIIFVLLAFYDIWNIYIRTHQLFAMQL